MSPEHVLLLNYYNVESLVHDFYKLHKNCSVLRVNNQRDVYQRYFFYRIAQCNARKFRVTQCQSTLGTTECNQVFNILIIVTGKSAGLL